MHAFESVAACRTKLSQSTIELSVMIPSKTTNGVRNLCITQDQTFYFSECYWLCRSDAGGSSNVRNLGADLTKFLNPQTCIYSCDSQPDVIDSYPVNSTLRQSDNPTSSHSSGVLSELEVSSVPTTRFINSKENKSFWLADSYRHLVKNNMNGSVVESIPWTFIDYLAAIMSLRRILKPNQ